MIGHSEIENRFAFHPADTEDRRVAHESVRATCKHLAHWLDDHLPDGREKSLAITHLEGVMFWANAAVARQ
jgi:hypothetical protein